ncbi:hypothetical protein ACTQ54_00530 [Fundicoccus sp. Sow4_H7]|uniref:hypothetical protein n=1 Tax=Fundicoccus sp. Sow4_H7 TaxID=3438784 RepID=UPI003F8DADA7
MKKSLKSLLVASSSMLVLSIFSGLATVNTVEGSEAQPFDEQVTLQVPVYDRGVEGVPDVSDNYWTQYVQENFGDPNNIIVEYIPITRSDVMTDYALLASAQELPTILMEYDYPKTSQWANEGYLATFDMEEFKAVAPNYFAQMDEAGLTDYSVMNGETYFVLGNRPNWANGFGFQQFYRKDWLKEVGYDEYPATYADWQDAMVKIQEAGLSDHPGGGTMIPSQGADLPWGFMDFPINEEDWASHISAVIPSLGMEANKELLRRENTNYNLGITDPEYYLTDTATAQAKFANGETFVFGSYMSTNMDWLNSFYEANPDAELGVVPPAENDEEAGTTAVFMADNPFGNIVGFSSMASEDEIRAAWMYLDWMADEENLFTMQWGFEDEHYTINEETGLPETIVGYEGDKTTGYNNNSDYWSVVTASRVVGDLEQQINAITPKGLPQDFTAEVLEQTERKIELGQEGYAVNFPIFTVPIEAESEYTGTLSETYKELRDTIVMADPSEFDTLYDEYAQRYADAGYAEIVEERRQAYNDGNSTKLLNIE